LKGFDKLLLDECTNHSKLSNISWFFTIKLDYGMHKAIYNSIIEYTKSILPKGNRLKENFYAAKSMMKPLGLWYQKIDTRLNFCMLYYSEDVNLTKCKICRHAWYKPSTGREMTFVAYKTKILPNHS
jgi:hypothetical protein